MLSPIHREQEISNKTNDYLLWLPCRVYVPIEEEISNKLKPSMKFEESLIAKEILKTIPSIKRKIEHIKTIKMHLDHSTAL